MSIMKKRIPMFLLALAIMVAMALPTFAAESRDYVGITAGYYKFNLTSTNLYLNINNQNAGTASSKDDVIVYKPVSTDDQVWYASPQGDGRWYLRHALNPACIAIIPNVKETAKYPSPIGIPSFSPF